MKCPLCGLETDRDELESNNGICDDCVERLKEYLEEEYPYDMYDLSGSCE